MNARATAALACASVLGVAAGACGGGGGGGETTTTAPTTGPASTAAAPATTQTEPVATAPSATTPPPDATGPEGQPGGAGDEEPIRVPARFSIRAGRLTPPEIAVPAFLRIGLAVSSRDGRAHEVLLAAPRTVVLRVPAGGRASTTIPGLRKGRWEISVDGRPAGALVAGAQPGP
jgi:hypothetical protein